MNVTTRESGAGQLSHPYAENVFGSPASLLPLSSSSHRGSGQVNRRWRKDGGRNESREKINRTAHKVKQIVRGKVGAVFPAQSQLDSADALG